MSGEIAEQWQGSCEASCDTASDVLSLDVQQIPPGCFLYVNWQDNQGIEGVAEYWPQPYKRFCLPQPTISVTEDRATQQLTLTTDKPAFFVSVELGGKRVWSDNGFTLLPGKPRVLNLLKTLHNSRTPDVEALSVQHLRQG